MATYVLSQKADQDLFGIYEYTLENWGIDQLKIYSAHIEQALRSLVKHPTDHRSIAREDLAEGCRCHKVQHHWIVYRLKRGQIEVARILHERMDFEHQQVGKDFP